MGGAWRSSQTNEGWDIVRNSTAQWQQSVQRMGWPVRLGISFGLAGFLAAMASVSFPVPWTPVPFSLAPLAILIVGAYQRPLWAALSVVLYLVAGGLGAPIFAEGTSGWERLLGNTGGYLFGYAVVAVLASWYVQERRRLVPMKWIATIAAFLGVLVIGGIAAIAHFAGTGAGFDAYGESYAAWGYGASTMWVFAFLTVAATCTVLWALLRARGSGTQTMNLYLMFLACTGVLHALGVAGLIVIGGLPFMTAVILGSVVFLPFDTVKAGLAVAATLPFLPEPRPAAETHEAP